jgi:hypothetical protein
LPEQYYAQENYGCNKEYLPEKIGIDRVVGATVHKAFLTLKLLQALRTINFYTTTVFHFPLLKKIKEATAMRLSATGMEMNDPVAPMFAHLVRKKAKGI